MLQLLTDLRMLWIRGALLVIRATRLLVPFVGQERAGRCWIRLLRSIPDDERWALILEGLGYEREADRLRDRVAAVQARYEERQRRRWAKAG